MKLKTEEEKKAYSDFIDSAVHTLDEIKEELSIRNMTFFEINVHYFEALKKEHRKFMTILRKRTLLGTMFIQTFFRLHLLTYEMMRVTESLKREHYGKTITILLILYTIAVMAMTYQIMEMFYRR